MILEKLNKYKEDGLLYSQVHPTLPLTIWNYSEKVQYEGLWDEITLMCRGLVTDEAGNIVARPFRKFFNMEEKKHTPTDTFEVYEKMDGSLGILFHYEGEWVLSTRGSFTSEQSIKGLELLKKYEFEKLHKEYTYLFEIIYNENRIVVDYSFEDVVLLGMIHTQTGYEVDIFPGNSDDLRYKQIISNIGLPVVKKFNGIKDYSTLKSMIKDNEEGYIVKFSNGNRMKIKGKEYLRLHRIMTNISTISIWEYLKNDDDIYNLLKDVPDEFYTKIDNYIEELNSQYYLLDAEYKWIFNNCKPFINNRAEFANIAKRYKHPAILFRMLDGKDYSDVIWKLIKPEFKKL